MTAIARIAIGALLMACVVLALAGCTINLIVPANVTAAKPAARPAPPPIPIPPGAVPGAPVNDPLHLQTRKIA